MLHSHSHSHHGLLTLSAPVPIGPRGPSRARQALRILGVLVVFSQVVHQHHLQNSDSGSLAGRRGGGGPALSIINEPHR